MSAFKRASEYLFKDYDYINRFGAPMDYDAYWTERSKQNEEMERAMYDYKFSLIARLIEPGSSVLDIGCGDGALLAYLQQNRDATPYGIELSETACAMASEKGITVQQTDISRLAADVPEVDYIVMSEVLEHLPNPEEVLLYIRGRFRKSLLVDVPNTGALNDRLRLLLGRFPKQWVFHAGEHIRFWTVTDFLRMCSQVGYGVRRYHGMYDPYYNLGLKLWKLYPRLFSRYVLYELQRTH